MPQTNIIDQLRSEMFAISHPNADTAGAGAIITLDPDVIEPPAKRRALKQMMISMYCLAAQIILNKKRFMLLMTTLAIPASTAPSERVFSTAKNILQKKRWRLLPNRLSKCIFLKKNSKFL